MSWRDGDLQPSDILAARLRAKFYGAHYIATRPYLDYAIHVMNAMQEGQSLEEAAVNGSGMPRLSELAVFRAIAGMDVEKVREKARTCVRSAIHSTVAFDRVPGRLVVTNIMGTAHA